MSKGFKYLSVPTAIPLEVLHLQDLATDTYMLEEEIMLSGSAEQGILSRYSNTSIDEPKKIWSVNQCFRKEDKYDETHYKEFKKIEQYIFTDESNGVNEFYETLLSTVKFMTENGFKARLIDEGDDEGHHILKIDIQVYSEYLNEWIETHSCSYFGTNQSEKFGMTGNFNHTISCTGLAFPRVLLGLGLPIIMEED